MLIINEHTASKLIQAYHTKWESMTPAQSEVMYKVAGICENACNVASYLGTEPQIIIPSHLVEVMSVLADEGKL